MEERVVSGVAYSRDEAQITLLRLADKPGTVAQICRVMSDANIIVDMIVQGRHTGVAQTMFEALAERNINVEVIATSEIKISVLIDSEYTELAVRALHNAFELQNA